MTHSAPGADVRPGCEPIHIEGGPTGVLLLHGWSGNPAGIRPWAEALGERGLTVSAPLLPGHGTRWEDLGTVGWGEWLDAAESAFDEVARRTAHVVVGGLSWGGGLALWLAGRFPEIRGAIVVNPYVRDPRLAIGPAARLVLRSWPGIGNDIKRAGQDELPYERLPVPALVELSRSLRAIRAALPSVRAPVLVFQSAVDHTIPRGNAEHVLARVAGDVELVALPDSYHVATLDNDAETLFERAAEFVARVVSPG